MLEHRSVIILLHVPYSTVKLSEGYSDPRSVPCPLRRRTACLYSRWSEERDDWVWHGAILYERQSASSDRPSKDESRAFLAIQLGKRHRDILKAIMAIQFQISEKPARTYNGTSHICHSSEPKKASTKTTRAPDYENQLRRRVHFCSSVISSKEGCECENRTIEILDTYKATLRLLWDSSCLDREAASSGCR
jgi:hypothetical protein